MKLPKNRKERIQILLLITLGVAGVIFAIAQLGVAPQIKARKEALATISSVQKKLKEATADIDRANKLGDKNKEIRAALRKIDEKYIIKAAYDQYRLAVTPIVERAAKIAGVQLREHSAISGQGQFGVVKGGKDKFARVLKGFKVQLSGTAGYEDLTDMLQILETENPYVSISDISIARTGDNRRHTVTFTMLWPIWQSEATAESFAEEKEGKKPTQS